MFNKETTMKATQLTDSKLMSELASAELACQMLVSSVHGVIHSGLANRLTELRDAAARQKLDRRVAEQRCKTNSMLGLSN
jgi:hypothetical protein